MRFYESYLMIETQHIDLDQVHLRFYVTGKGQLRIIELRWGNGKRYDDRQQHWFMPRFRGGVYRESAHEVVPAAALAFCNSPEAQALMKAEVNRLARLYRKAGG